MNKSQFTLYLLTILLLIPIMACDSPAPKPTGVREYSLEGRVESIDMDKQRVTIAHEKIDGYMDAMTMPFPVRDAEILRGLKSGDRITARLFVDHDRNMSWIEVQSKK